MINQVINFRDAQLYDSDVALFTEFMWLNDNAIHFYFAYLHQYVCNESTRVLFADPAVVSCLLLQCDDDQDLKEMTCGWKLHEKELCFFPVNNRQSFEEYGSHWSLIVFRKNEKGLEHYDSSEPLNEAAAIRTCDMLRRVFQLSTDDDEVLRSADVNYGIIKRSCAQQANEYDCGMHVLLVAEYLTKAHFKSVNCSLQEYVSPMKIRERRLEIPSLIKRLQENA
ncbi:unnamed protein product [Albugo candida]|uniref:Ubiquitin-like protease family profile domain-containing protein n=1 Tax=Albugo candida TaxID=65357 RepID=A0A024G6Y2_9STRA|nr:unnamed protein product [Albugo candida]|eukprot:CCI42314.1 unnamed protein product [Albugo candida]